MPSAKCPCMIVQLWRSSNPWWDESDARERSSDATPLLNLCAGAHFALVFVPAIRSAGVKTTTAAFRAAPPAALAGVLLGDAGADDGPMRLPPPGDGSGEAVNERGSVCPGESGSGPALVRLAAAASEPQAPPVLPGAAVRDAAPGLPAAVSSSISSVPSTRVISAGLAPATCASCGGGGAGV